MADGTIQVGMVGTGRNAKLRRVPGFRAMEGVEIVSGVEKSKHGHTFFFVKDCDGNLIELIDLKYRYSALKYLGWLGGWLFRRGMYKEHYG